MSRTVKNLRRYGWTNFESEDISTLASTKKKPSYDWYCSSVKCCAIDKEFYSKQTHKMVRIKQFKNRVLKVADSSRNHDKCPDCGNMLFSKRTAESKD